MIRTWGYGVVGEDQSSTGRDAFGVFQFYRHTLAVVIYGGEGNDEGLLARVALRAIHDVARDVREDDDGADALRSMIEAADASATEVREQHGLTHTGLAASALWIGAEQLWFAHSGPAHCYHLRGVSGRRLGADHGRHLIGTGLGATVEIAGPSTLKPDDVLLLLSLSASGAIVPRALVEEDWGMPQRGVRRLLEGLQGAVPADAVAVAVAMRKSPEFIRPTNPPKIEVLLQELLARHGRDDARSAVSREIVEDVNPEWGKGSFIKEEAKVQREKLEYKELDRAEEEEEVLSAWEQFILGFIVLRDKLFQAFRSEKGRRQLNMASAALVVVFGLLLIAGLVLDTEALQGDATSEAAVSGSEGRADARGAGRRGDGGSTNDADAGRRGDGGSTNDAGAARTGGKAQGREPVEAASPWRRLGGLLLLACSAGAAMAWRRKRINDAEAERQRVREDQLRALLDRAIRAQGDQEVGQKLLASDGQTALATLLTAGVARERLLLVIAPRKLDVAEDSPEQEFTRPRTHVVDPATIISCQIVQNMRRRENKQGGARQEWVERLELQLRIADAVMPDLRVSILHVPTPPGSLPHFEALAVAQHWEGVVLAQAHAASGRSALDQLVRLRPLVDEGLLTRDELALLRRAMGRRRSGLVAPT